MAAADHVQEANLKLHSHRNTVSEAPCPGSADHLAINNFSSKISRSSLRILHSRYVNVQSIHSTSLRKVQEVEDGDEGGDGDGYDDGDVDRNGDDDGKSNTNILTSSTVKSDSRRSYSSSMLRPSIAISREQGKLTIDQRNKNNSIPPPQPQDQARPKGLMKRLGSFLSSRKKPVASVPAMKPSMDHSPNSWSLKKLQSITPLQQSGSNGKENEERSVQKKMVIADVGGDGTINSDLLQVPDHPSNSVFDQVSSVSRDPPLPSSEGTKSSAGLMAELPTSAVVGRLEGSNTPGISSSLISSSAGYGNLIMQELNTGSSRGGSGRHGSSTNRGVESSSSSSSLHVRRKSLRRVWEQVGGRVFSCGSSSGHMSGILIAEMDQIQQRSAMPDLPHLERTISSHGPSLSCRGASSRDAIAYFASYGDGESVGPQQQQPQRLEEELVMDEDYWLSLAESILARQRQEEEQRRKQMQSGCNSSRDADGDTERHGVSALRDVVETMSDSTLPAAASFTSSTIVDISADHESMKNIDHCHESGSESPWEKLEVQSRPQKQEDDEALVTGSELQIEEQEEASSPWLSPTPSSSSSSSSKLPDTSHETNGSAPGVSFDSCANHSKKNKKKKQPWRTMMQMAGRPSVHQQGYTLSSHHRLNTKLEESPCLLQNHHLQRRLDMGSSRSECSSSGNHHQNSIMETRVRSKSSGTVEQYSSHHHHHSHHHNQQQSGNGAESSGIKGGDRISEQGAGVAVVVKEALQPLEKFLMQERADGQASMEVSLQKEEEEEEEEEAVVTAEAGVGGAGGGRTSLMALLHEEKDEEEDEEEPGMGMICDHEELVLNEHKQEHEEEEEDDDEDEDEDEDEDDGDKAEEEEEKKKTQGKTKKMKKKKKKMKKKKEKEMAMANDPLQCCVCMVGRRGAALIPCGHTFCRSCSKQLFAERGACPLCNNLIAQVLHIF